MRSRTNRIRLTLLQTRMHSSRMRTARFRCHMGGVCLGGLAGVCLAMEVSPRRKPPVNRMTRRCRNITLTQTSFVDGKNMHSPLVTSIQHRPSNFTWCPILLIRWNLVCFILIRTIYMSHFASACKTEGQNGICRLISALCINCLSSISEYSRLNHLDVYLV